MAKLSDRLRVLRKERHMTQKDMAELLNCTPSHYQKIEYGKVNISVSMLALLSDHFHVSTDYILGRAENQDINR